MSRRYTGARLIAPPDKDAGNAARGGLDPMEYVADNLYLLNAAAQMIVVCYVLAGEPDLIEPPVPGKDPINKPLSGFTYWDLGRKAVYWAGGGNGLASRTLEDQDDRNESVARGTDLVELMRLAHERNPNQEWLRYNEIKPKGFARGNDWAIAIRCATWRGWKIESRKYQGGQQYSLRVKVGDDWVFDLSAGGDDAAVRAPDPAAGMTAADLDSNSRAWLADFSEAGVH